MSAHDKAYIDKFQPPEQYITRSQLTGHTMEVWAMSDLDSAIAAMEEVLGEFGVKVKHEKK